MKIGTRVKTCFGFGTVVECKYFRKKVSRVIVKLDPDNTWPYKIQHPSFKENELEVISEPT